MEKLDIAYLGMNDLKAIDGDFKQFHNTQEKMVADREESVKKKAIGRTTTTTSTTKAKTSTTASSGTSRPRPEGKDKGATGKRVALKLLVTLLHAVGDFLRNLPRNPVTLCLGVLGCENCYS